MSLDLLIDFQPFELEAEGHKITMELRPLTREYMILLNAIFDSLALEQMEREVNKEEDKFVKIKGKKVNVNDIKTGLKIFKASLEHQKYADPVFKSHVRNINGLTINGKVPTPEQFANEPSLCNITVEILTELVNRSNLKANEVKN